MRILSILEHLRLSMERRHRRMIHVLLAWALRVSRSEGSFWVRVPGSSSEIYKRLQEVAWGSRYMCSRVPTSHDLGLGERSLLACDSVPPASVLPIRGISC